MLQRSRCKRDFRAIESASWEEARIQELRLSNGIVAVTLGEPGRGAGVATKHLHYVTALQFSLTRLGEKFLDEVICRFLSN
ncbi:MAG: hypothetical protein HYX72_11085 [Acidobacteria bacterium]|nr:hypothetical protein [Acidobacteriota bacterium]